MLRPKPSPSSKPSLRLSSSPTPNLVSHSIPQPTLYTDNRYLRPVPFPARPISARKIQVHTCFAFRSRLRRIQPGHATSSYSPTTLSRALSVRASLACATCPPQRVIQPQGPYSCRLIMLCPIAAPVKLLRGLGSGGLGEYMSTQYAPVVWAP